MPEQTLEGCGLGITFQRSGTRLCMDWINDNCDKECEPGITVAFFKYYIKSQVTPNLPEYFSGIAHKAVEWETARHWLHLLGIKY